MPLSSTKREIRNGFQNDTNLIKRTKEFDFTMGGVRVLSYILANR